MKDDVHRQLLELGENAREERPPPIDVRESVMRSISAHARPLRRDRAPLVLCVATVSIAACVVIAFMPAIRTMTEPWACYLP